MVSPCIRGIDLYPYQSSFISSRFPRAYGDRHHGDFRERHDYGGFPVHTGIDLSGYLVTLAYTGFPRAYGDRP